jgi:hypothetical protein
VTEDRFQELINREIDRELSPEEQVELRKYLDQNPRLVVTREEMLRLSGVLSEIPAAEPPEALRENIMSAVAARGARPKEIVIRPQARFRTLLSRLGFDHPYSFAAGALAAVALLVVVLILNPDSFPGDKNGLTGTIVPTERTDGFTVLDYHEIDAPGATGRVELARAGSEIRMQLNLESDTDIDAVVRFDADRLAAAGLTPHRAGWSQITVEPGEVRIHHEGTNQYDLIWRQTELENTTIYFALLSEGVLFEDTLNIPGSPDGPGTQSQ